MRHKELLFNKYNLHNHHLICNLDKKEKDKILNKLKKVYESKSLDEYEKLLFSGLDSKNSYVIKSALFSKEYKKELYPLSVQLEFMLFHITEFKNYKTANLILSYDENYDSYLLWYEFFESLNDELVNKKKRKCVFVAHNHRVIKSAFDFISEWNLIEQFSETYLDYSHISEYVKDKIITAWWYSSKNNWFLINNFFDYEPHKYYETNNFKELFTKSSSKKAKAKKKDLKNKILLKDVVGLNEVKKSIVEKIVLPIQHKELYEEYDKQIGGGILLYGLPGTGKTMFAKAIANEIDAYFISIKPGDLKSMWVGESQQRIKELFKKARTYKKAIIFFDEFEAIGGKRTNQAVRRSIANILVPELLAQIQGIKSKDDNDDKEKDINELLLIIAATNRPQDIDSALLRPGRFDTKIYIDLPDKKARRKMFQLYLKAVDKTNQIDLDYLADISQNFSGADIHEFVDQLKMKVIKRKIDDVNAKEISMDDVYDVEKKFKCSVDLDELNALKRFLIKDKTNE